MELRDFLLRIGFVVNPADPCVFVRATKDDGKGHIIIVIYVDDLIISCIHESEIDEIIKDLTDKFVELTIY